MLKDNDRFEKKNLHGYLKSANVPLPSANVGKLKKNRFSKKTCCAYLFNNDKLSNLTLLL